MEERTPSRRDNPRGTRPSGAIALALLATLCAALCACDERKDRRAVTLDDVMNTSSAPADHRLRYGDGPQQFGDLRLPMGPGPHPVAIVIHGGCWLAAYGLDYMDSACVALTRAGIATWNIEYRRIGDGGGGWPGTYRDVGAAADSLRAIAPAHGLDLERVVVVGHSAGGQLALWMAGRDRISPESAIFTPNPLRVRGVVVLEGITDLAAFGGGCGGAVRRLFRDVPEQQVAGVVRQCSPIDMLPLGVTQRLIHGKQDEIVPIEMAKAYEREARARGDDATLVVVDGAGHFEVVAPGSFAWPVVERAVLELTNATRPSRRSE